MAEASRGLDRSTTKELVEHALRAFAGDVVAANAMPVVEAALEAAQQSSIVAGHDHLAIRGISIKARPGDPSEGDGNRTVFEASSTRFNETRDPIGMGGSDWFCVLVCRDPVMYLCFDFGF